MKIIADKVQAIANFRKRTNPKAFRALSADAAYVRSLEKSRSKGVKVLGRRRVAARRQTVTRRKSTIGRRTPKRAALSMKVKVIRRRAKASAVADGLFKLKIATLRREALAAGIENVARKNRASLILALRAKKRSKSVRRKKIVRRVVVRKKASSALVAKRLRRKKKKTVEQLQRSARALGVKNIGKKNRAALMSAISAKRRSTPLRRQASKKTYKSGSGKKYKTGSGKMYKAAAKKSVKRKSAARPTLRALLKKKKLSQLRLIAKRLAVEKVSSKKKDQLITAILRRIAEFKQRRKSLPSSLRSKRKVVKRKSAPKRK